MEEFQCTIEYLHVLHVPLSVMFISWLVFWVHSSSTAAVHNVAETDFKAKVLKYFNKTTNYFGKIVFWWQGMNFYPLNPKMGIKDNFISKWF